MAMSSIQRRYSDPIMVKHDILEPLSTNVNDLKTRRNGKHNIYLGMYGDDVLSLFIKYDKLNDNCAKSNLHKLNGRDQFMSNRSSSYCSSRNGLELIGKQDHILENMVFTGFKDSNVVRVVSSKTVDCSSLENSPLIKKKIFNNFKECKYDIRVCNSQGNSPRLSKRRNGVSYINSLEMMLKMNQLKKRTSSQQMIFHDGMY